MPRARRYFIPGYVWHITQRCHEKNFLLKFQRDRIFWQQLLFKAKKRFGLCVLNYIATSNHIHLLVKSQTEDDISKSMQLIAGETAGQYNLRKDRHGAFWQDRYHATAVSTEEHIFRCLVYIDLNMVRAGKVAHPKLWDVSGYHEIYQDRKRYRILDIDSLLSYANVKTLSQFRELHTGWINANLSQETLKREPDWSEAIAIGDQQYVNKIQQLLDPSGFTRTIYHSGQRCVLRETREIYE